MTAAGGAGLASSPMGSSNGEPTIDMKGTDRRRPALNATEGYYGEERGGLGQRLQPCIIPTRERAAARPLKYDSGSMIG